MGERKIRIVEAETEEFQLPLLGFHGHHRKSASDETTDNTMLSSTTLYTTLNPTDGIDVPIRRIATPSRTAKPISQSPLHNGNINSVTGAQTDAKGISEAVGKNSGVIHVGQLKYNSPGSMETKTPVNVKPKKMSRSLRAESESNSRVGEIPRIMRGGEF